MVAVGGSHRKLHPQVVAGVGGAGRDRTGDLVNAIHARSQLRYSPTGQKKNLAACPGGSTRREDDEAAAPGSSQRGDRELEGACRFRDVGLALADHRERAAGRVQEAHVEAVRLAGPAVADAGRAGQDEDRDELAVTAVVDVRRDAVRERTVPRARRLDVARLGGSGGVGVPRDSSQSWISAGSLEYRRAGRWRRPKQRW